MMTYSLREKERETVPNNFSKIHNFIVTVNRVCLINTNSFPNILRFVETSTVLMQQLEFIITSVTRESFRHKFSHAKVSTCILHTRRPSVFFNARFVVCHMYQLCRIVHCPVIKLRCRKNVLVQREKSISTHIFPRIFPTIVPHLFLFSCTIILTVSVVCIMRKRDRWQCVTHISERITYPQLRTFTILYKVQN